MGSGDGQWAVGSGDGQWAVAMGSRQRAVGLFVIEMSPDSSFESLVAPLHAFKYFYFIFCSLRAL